MTDVAVNLEGIGTISHIFQLIRLDVAYIVKIPLKKRLHFFTEHEQQSICCVTGIFVAQKWALGAKPGSPQGWQNPKEMYLVKSPLVCYKKNPFTARIFNNINGVCVLSKREHELDLSRKASL